MQEKTNIETDKSTNAGGVNLKRWLAGKSPIRVAMIMVTIFWLIVCTIVLTVEYLTSNKLGVDGRLIVLGITYGACWFSIGLAWLLSR